MIERTKNLFKCIIRPKWIVLLFSFTIPLGPQWNAKVQIASLAFVLFTSNLKGAGYKIIYRAWDVLIFLTVLAIGLVYSYDIIQGLKVLETSFSLFSLMIIANLREEFDEMNVHKVLMAFIFGVAITCLICLGYATYRSIVFEDSRYFFSYALTEIVRSHPTYLAYFLIVSITYCISLMFYEQRQIKNINVILMVVLFFVVLILTGGRTSYISAILIFSFFILKFIIEGRSQQKRIIFILVTTLLLSLLVSSRINIPNAEVVTPNDYWERAMLWKSAFKANPSPLIGVGTGDYKLILNEYYVDHGMKSFAVQSYNSHNQFIQLYFSNGIIGLFAFLVMIGRPLYFSVRYQNALGVLFLFPFIIYGVTEVFLGRYQGVVLYALLHQIVIHQYYNSVKSFSLKKGLG